MWSLVVGDQPCFLWDVVHMSRLECWGTAPQVCLPPGKCSPAATEKGGAKAWPVHPSTHSVLFTEPWLCVRDCSGFWRQRWNEGRGVSELTPLPVLGFSPKPQGEGLQWKRSKKSMGSGLGRNDRRWSLSFSSLEGREAHTIAGSR